MVNLSTFSEYKLDKNQMKNVVGGTLEVSCTCANGNNCAVFTGTEAQIAAAIDGWNAGHSSQYQIVGCDIEGLQTPN